MNRKVIITRGLSGSGKTTWSKQFVKDNPTYLRVSRDDIDFMLSEQGYSKEKAEIIFSMRNMLIADILSKGYNLVLDETYLVPERIKELNQELETYCAWTGEHVDVSIQDFIDVPVQTCIDRDKERHFHVGEEFIKSYYEKYITPLLSDKGVTAWTI